MRPPWSAFGKPLTAPGSDRVGVRMAIAQLMAQEGHSEDAERQIALAQMEGEAGDAAPPNGSQFIAAADVFRSMHDYELSQTYLQRAKAAGAPDAEVRIGLANNYLALGDTARAHAELAAVSAVADDTPDYQYLLAEANVYRQQHRDAQARLLLLRRHLTRKATIKPPNRLCSRRERNEGLRITTGRESAFGLFDRAYLRRLDGLCPGLEAGCGISGAEYRYRRFFHSRVPHLRRKRPTHSICTLGIFLPPPAFSRCATRAARYLSPSETRLSIAIPPITT